VVQLEFRSLRVPKVRDKEDAVEVVEAAYWMKGCRSLGRLPVCGPAAHR
jgi:2-keto-3-deoxy-L-rhamnonate aldolase RhmA